MKKSLSSVLAASLIISNFSPTLGVFANELQPQVSAIEESKVSQANVRTFTLSSYNNFEAYNEQYLISREDIVSISNNGGQYSSSSLDKAFDHNLSTHWETGTQNSSSFKNEVIVEFKDVQSINRLAYATRQDSAKGKGFPTEFEIYTSLSGEEADFRLAVTGSHSSTGNMMEFKFDTVEAKKFKFVFKSANQNWASASEFWFYKEDLILDKMERIFTNDSKNELSEEFNTIEKLNEFKLEASQHPLYEVIKEEVENAELLLTSDKVTYVDAAISKFIAFNDERLTTYDALYKIPREKITNITTNGGQYASNDITKSIDNDASTHWHSGKQNTSTFTNEVIITLDELTTINRVMYTNNRSRGYAQEFDIYISKTSQGETFEKVTSGQMDIDTKNTMEIVFNPTAARRVKFVFKKGYEDWAIASEFGVYKTDSTYEKMNNIFTNDSKNELSEAVNTIEKLNAFEEEVSQHPLYDDVKEDIQNARALLEAKEVTYMDAIISKFASLNDERLTTYDNLYKIPREKIKSITTNGGSYAENDINRAIDNDASTHWHSGKQNTASFTNEVIITLEELTTINRIMYTDNYSRGFAQEFEIYVSTTTKGETFEKVTSGQMNVDTKNTMEILFNPTAVRRIKFVFTKGYEDWAFASEFGLYKQDSLSEVMSRLFVDDSMSELNPEFTTIATIESLIEKANNHPFANEYIEKLTIAKELIEFGIIQSGTSNVSKFTPFYTDYIEQYDEMFRIPISGISNNGKSYWGAALEYAIDEDVTTHWETATTNSSSFKNEVILTLDQVTEINRLTYKARTINKGFPTKFSIYVSPVAVGDNFQKVSEGGYTVTNDMLEIQFDKTKAKRIKFVFEEAYQDRPSIGDIRVYKEDAVSNQMKSLFTNGLMNEVSEAYNTLEKLAVLENEVSNHPLTSIYQEDIQLAKDIINNELQTVKTVVAEQHGDRNVHANQNLKFGFGNNNQPTGVVAKPGDTVVVYVDVEPGQPLPQLVFSQQEGSFANWGRTVSLHAGKNVIIVPEVTQNDGWYRHSVTPGGAVYIVNPYTEDQQGKAPVIRFAEGVELFPLMDENTDEQEFLELLKDYKARVDADKEANPDVMDRQMIDVVEIVSDHLVFTGTATGAYEAYVNQGFSPLQTVNMYNDHMDLVFEYLGLDGSNELNDVKYTRENIRLAQPFGYMYAASNHIGVQGDVMVSMLTTVGGWGVDHEMGHRLDIGVRTIGEVTNNMIPQNSSYYYNQPNKRIPFESHVYKNVIAKDNNEYYSGSYFENLAVFWQLEMIYPGYWAKLNRQYRENNVVLDSQNTENDRLNQLAKYSSIALELDLTEHFERHGFFVSDETKEFVSQYKKPEVKTWYANYDYIEYKGNGFEKETGLVVERLTHGEHNQLVFKVNADVAADVLGYEIFKDEELIGFTSTNSFIDTTTEVGEAVEYKVIPYDKKLNPGEEVHLHSLAPTIMTSQEKVIVKLNEAFEPMNLAKAYTYTGEEMTNAVTVNHSVDMSQKGIYPVTFMAEDQGMTTAKTIKVEVVSDYDYLSDIEWTDVETVWGTPRRNENIKGRINGDIQTFEQGFGIHANGKITYDLTDLDYDRFEALIGVDMNLASQLNSSLQVKVIADGQVLAKTPILKHADNMVSVDVPVKGVKELVIEINDAGNGNTSDHAIIANPKLITNNAQPKLTVIDYTYHLGDMIDLNEGMMAFDAEDGDLTEDIQIVSSNFEPNKAGRFEITYQVTDSDENTVSKTQNIFVYSTEINLSDLEWTSASSGWKTVNKDTAVNTNNPIKLKVDGEIKTFDKGIGAATNAEIVYDLNGEYAHFTTYVGTDKNYDDNRTSIIFKIYADGKEVYTSDMIYRDSEAEFVSLNVEGVQQLTLIADEGGNGGLGDFASWGEPMLYQTNAKPQLTIPNDTAVKVGQPFKDIVGIYIAIDAEDGELTNSVEVSGAENVNFDCPGKYTITYTVTDSDGNQVKKTRTISVVDMNDFTYLTDYDWKSANQSYGSAKKDISASGNTLRLTNEDGSVVTYEHGIGAHSTSTIVYDLSDKEYQFFSSYVGVDRQMYGSVGSVVFQVYVDGEKQFDSGLMNSRDPQQYVEVNLAGAKELKLVVTDGGNGDGSDHATWGDTKLHFANSEREEIKRESLDTLLEEIDSLTASDYTESSWLNLMQVLQEVTTQLAAGYNQETINQLTATLQEAYEKLEKVVIFDELVQLITTVEEMNLSAYTSESIEQLQTTLEQAKALVENATLQPEVDQMIEKLQTAINQLEESEDLNQVVGIKDDYLKAEIIKTLNLQKNEVTVGDLLNLTSLTLSNRVKNLEGLQYAKNLESLEFPHAEVTDLSPLKDLTKLTKIVADWQIIEGGMLERTENKVSIDHKVINRQGERVIPSSIMVRHNQTFTEMPIDLATSMNENGVISFDTTSYETGSYSVFIVYENEADNYQAQVLYMFRVE
ncbi:MAG: NPCBM/NEW2 domain-containing protein [Turicibacter sp.]|nr:NPCBM/NEW2 domain-containing protein [Turicibacter sp.]